MASPSASPSIRTLQATTSLASTTLASLNLSLSFFLVPRLLDLPTPLMLKQWAASYRRTSAIFPIGMLACGLSYATLAFRLSSSAVGPTKARLLGAAAALCFSIFPWTRFLMVNRINAKLVALSERLGAKATVEDLGIQEDEGAAAAAADDEASFTVAEEENAKWLVDQWGLYNLGRGLPVAVAGAIGLFTLL